jgi:hypothetical protein
MSRCHRPNDVVATAGVRRHAALSAMRRGSCGPRRAWHCLAAATLGGLLVTSCSFPAYEFPPTDGTSGAAGGSNMSAGSAGAGGQTPGAGNGGAGAGGASAGGGGVGVAGAGGAAATKCGNGTVDDPEQCDEGDERELCSADCTVVVPPKPLGCDESNGGVPVHVFDDEVAVDGNTATAGPTTTAQIAEPDCDDEAVELTAEANDVVFRVEPHRSGDLLIQLDPVVTQFDTVLYARTGSCEGAMIRCEDPEAPDSGESMVLTVEDGKPLWVVVDGFGEEYRGPFRLRFLFVE